MSICNLLILLLFSLEDGLIAGAIQGKKHNATRIVLNTIFSQNGCSIYYEGRYPFFNLVKYKYKLINNTSPRIERRTL